MFDGYSTYVEAQLRIQDARTLMDQKRLARLASSGNSSRPRIGSRTLISSAALALRSMLASVASIAY